MPKKQIFADAETIVLAHDSSRNRYGCTFVADEFSVRLAKRERLLIGELDHRVKNMLTLVSALIERTREGSGSTDDLVQSLQNRIGSMACTHALLSWGGDGRE